MKRLLFLIVLAVLATALLGLLASPAFAYQEPVSFAPGNAYVAPRSELWGGNLWVEVDANGEFTFHNGDTEAIPQGYDVWVVMGFVAPTRGVVRTVPISTRYAFTLTGPGFSWTSDAAASRQLWTVLYNAGFYPAFNKESAIVWERDLYKELGVLGSGSYSGTTTERIGHPVADLSFYGETWSKHAQQTPVMIPAGRNDYTFAFTIAAP